MIKLLQKGLLLLVITAIPYFLIQRELVNRYDRDYLKLARGKHSSMITGVSRASWGISPQIIRQELGLNHEPQNLAVNSAISPYGQAYLSLLQRKAVDQPDKGSIVLICVSPASIMDLENENQRKRESDQLIHKLRFVNQKTNFEYILRKNLSPGLLFKSLKKPLDSNPRVRYKTHQNGWYEAITVKDFERRSIRTWSNYRKSNDREKYLIKTIDFFVKDRTVCLIRMPIDPEMQRKEAEVYPGFDSLMMSIASEKSIHYLNYAAESESYEFFDKPGNHLVSESARRFTLQLTKDLIERYPGQW